MGSHTKAGAASDVGAEASVAVLTSASGELDCTSAMDRFLDDPCRMGDSVAVDGDKAKPATPEEDGGAARTRSTALGTFCFEAMESSSPDDDEISDTSSTDVVSLI